MKMNLFRLFLPPIVMITLLLSGCGGVKQKVKNEPFQYIVTEEIEQVNEEAETNGSIWESNQGLFADRRAKNVNDILTVNIVESSSAKRKAATSTGRETSVNGGITSFFGAEQAFHRHVVLAADLQKTAIDTVGTFVSRQDFAAAHRIGHRLVHTHPIPGPLRHRHARGFQHAHSLRDLASSSSMLTPSAEASLHRLVSDGLSAPDSIYIMVERGITARSAS